MKAYIIWIALIIGWNFGFPNMSPLSDTLAAIILSAIHTLIKRHIQRN